MTCHDHRRGLGRALEARSRPSGQRGELRRRRLANSPSHGADFRRGRRAAEGGRACSSWQGRDPSGKASQNEEVEIGSRQRVWARKGEILEPVKRERSCRRSMTRGVEGRPKSAPSEGSVDEKRSSHHRDQGTALKKATEAIMMIASLVQPAISHPASQPAGQKPSTSWPAGRPQTKPQLASHPEASHRGAS